MSKSPEGEFYFNESLLAPEKLEPGNIGYLEPGFHFNDKGQIVDEKGSIYDEAYNILHEAPSEELKKGLEIARKQGEREKWTDEQVRAAAKFYAYRLRKERELGEKQKRKREKKSKRVRR